jgi:hypothetical protein
VPVYWLIDRYIKGSKSLPGMGRESFSEIITISRRKIKCVFMKWEI